MKAVASVKPGPPDKYKARIVVCGNFAKEKEGEALDNAASGIDSVAIRTVLNVAAHRGWTAGTTDVSGAFLKAPRRTNDRRVTICEPPVILKNMKLVEQGERWIIHQALYGLQESPGDWGHHRDQNIAELKWETNGQWFRFQRTSERHLWEIVADDDPTTSRGFLVVYVDDMMAVGDLSQVKAALNAIRSRWDCSPVEVLEEEKSMRFCGFELRKSDVGIILSQEGYTRSLLKRRNVEGKEPHPIPKIQEEIEEEAHTVYDLRQAQALVGEVLWLSTRSRPDISYSVGTLGRMLHKRPRYVVQLAQHLLRYLNGSPGVGLLYKPCGVGDLGNEDQLSQPRSTDRIDVYSDVSYAPSCESYRSIQGIAVEHAGNLVAWETGRQTIVALSTCEAELTSYMEAYQVGCSIAELLKVTGYDVKKHLLGDSKSALTAATAESGSWRTRHLRLRASALRQALQTSAESGWEAKHLKGERLVADGFTKSLTGLVFDRFRMKLGLYEPTYPQEAMSMSRCQVAGSKLLAAVGGLLAFVGVSNCSEGLLGAAVALCALSERVGTTRASGQRPGSRPQQDHQKNEGRDTCVGLDRSGTVPDELKTGTGKPSVSKLGSTKFCVRALRAGDQDGHRAPQGATQLPVRPSGRPQGSTAAARGRAADGTMVALGGHHRQSEEAVAAEGYRGEVAQGGSEEGVGTTAQAYSGIEVVSRDLMSPTPVRMLTSVCYPLTRATLEGDRPGAVPVWDLEMFHRVPRGDDKWLLTWDHLLIRSHGRPRTRSFHPLHRSTPYPLTMVQARRCTILFSVTGGERQVKIDTWHQNLPIFEGQWRGYAIFDLGRSNDEQPSSLRRSESDGSYELYFKRKTNEKGLELIK